MPENRTDTKRYWLLVGVAPTGPFTVSQILDKLAIGETTWQSEACPFGETVWLPLAMTPGIGPDAAFTTVKVLEAKMQEIGSCVAETALGSAPFVNASLAESSSEPGKPDAVERPPARDLWTATFVAIFAVALAAFAWFASRNVGS